MKEEIMIIQKQRCRLYKALSSNIMSEKVLNKTMECLIRLEN